MNEVQELISALQGKIKKQIDELAKIEQDAAGRRSLIMNDKNELKKILQSMEDVFDED